MKSKTLSKSEIKELNKNILETYGLEPLNKKEKTQIIEDANIKYLKINKEIPFFFKNDKLIPSLKSLHKENFLKKITVDMGAVKFVCSGADIMRPGITQFEDGIKKGDIISIIDENNKKALAVGITLFNSEELREQKTGKSIKNIHYAGDEIWNL